MSSWNSGAVIMTSTQVHLAVSIITRYSGKYGTLTMTSSPGLVRAEMVMSKAAVAPAVM